MTTLALRPTILVTALTLALTACPNQEVVPLIGEGPEIHALLGADSPDDPSRSALAAARRLHQSLMQSDAATIWTLLAAPTRRALDERGAAISASGRELLDASTLPGPDGTIRKVRYESILFGRNIVDLKDSGESVTTPAGERRAILAVSKDGAIQELMFVREDDGWKLLKTGF